MSQQEFKPIIYSDWPKLADIEWRSGPLPPTGSAIYVCMEVLDDFFHELENSNENQRYILITGASDYSIVEQKDAPVWADLNRWMHGFMAVGEEFGYRSLNIPVRCDVTRCKETDKYSIKVYSYTRATFNEIPRNIVKWYCVNNDLDDPRIVHLPFGLADWSAPLIEAMRKRKESWPERNINCYINFQPNTTERARLLSNNRNHLVDVDEYGNLKEIPHADFVNRLLRSKAVLSPSGNGLDTIRNSESIHLGAIPIILARGNGRWSEPYKSLGAQIINEYGITLNQPSVPPFDLTGTPLDFTLWQNRIAADKNSLQVNHSFGIGNV